MTISEYEQHGTTPAPGTQGDLLERLPDQTTAMHWLAACKTADEVAELLRRHGVRGDIGCSDTCPIACFLGGGEAIVVAPGEVVFDSGRHWSTPSVVELFIERFDGKAYPDLIEP